MVDSLPLPPSVKDNLTVMVGSSLIPDEIITAVEPDFEDDRANDASMKADLDDLFGSVVSGRNLDDISEDEWEALRDG